MIESQRRILISGAGIAGPTLAYWLLHYGFEPTLVERAHELRTGGYIVDFWGVGYDVAERMGLVPELRERGYDVTEVRFVGRDGARVAGFSTDALRRAANNRFVSLRRSDLSHAIYARIQDKIETVFGDSVTGLAQEGEGVRVTFERAPPRTFAAVIGADGLHSAVRRLAFGEQRRFERFLGYKVAAFETSEYRPRDELVYVSYAQPGIHAARFAMRDDRTLFLFVYADDGGGEGGDANDRRELHERFGDAGWECQAMLGAMDRSDVLYADRVSQIHMDRWREGRVCLIGDAASCPSLLAGEGSGLAMAAAYTLAGALKRSRDHRESFARYEAALRPFIERKQKSARRLAGAFAPRTHLGLIVRNVVTNAMSIPGVAHLALGRTLRDDFALPS